MARRRRLRSVPFGAHMPGRSARFRLTALYCCLFFPSGVLLVGVTYVLIILVQRPVVHLSGPVVRTISADVHKSAHLKSVTDRTALHGSKTTVVLGHLTATLPGHVVLDTGELVVGLCIVLAAMIGGSVLLAWLVAGRILQPLRIMTTSTRQISERNLHERLALSGPNDELKDLGDTIDGLLARLEAAFDAQRRFVANASHELRTPLMLGQTLLQVALADPHITLDSLRAACQEAVDAGKDQAQLLEALLVLARSQRGLEHREPVDLAGAVNDAVNAHAATADARGLHVDASLDNAEVPGDPRLIYRLVSNLVDNAIRYNITNGRVEVKLAASTTEATLTVTNTGPPVPPDEVGRLLEPFQRAAPDRTANPSGLGLGLSIVADIAKAHGANLDVRSRPEGGLTIEVSFPVDPSVSSEATPS